MKTFCLLSDERAFQSKSPALFTAVMKRVGIRGTYVPFKVNPNHVGLAMQSLRVLNIDGATVTVPYKEAVLSHMDVLSEGANIIGAVNTIVRNGDELKGYNTNAIGFMDTLEEIQFDVAGKKAVVFGTGGAAKSVIFVLNWLRAESVVVIGRDEAHLMRVVNKNGGTPKFLDTILQTPIIANIVVNATSVSSPNESHEMAAIVEQLNIKNCDLLIDMNYGRVKNFWQDAAEKSGILFMDGIKPLAHMARRCFALWTRIDVEPTEFIHAIDSIS